MAQAGFTPISLYFSTTAAAVPTSANLVAGELALNTVDEKLYFKNSAGTVKLLASNATSAPVLSFQTSLGGLTPSTATTGVVTLAGTLNTTSGGTGLTSFTAGDVPYYASGSVLSKLAIGTAGQILTSTGTAPQWSTLSGVAVTTFSAGTTGFTPSSATSGAVTLAGTLATTNGGTNLTSFTSGGVVYASSSSALATGSALYFDGTNLGIGNTSPTSYNGAADNLVIGTSGNNGMTIVSGSTSSGYIMFADGTTGQQAYEGQITYDHTSNFMAFNTSGTEKLRLDTSGNLGLGVTPSAWGNTYKAFQAGTTSVLAGVASQTNNYVLHNFVNCYNDNTNWIYIASQEAGRYEIARNVHKWFNAPSGTAGNAITFTQAMTLDASGNLGLAETNPSAYGGFVTKYAGIGLHANSTSGASGLNLYEGGTGRFSLRTLNGSAGLSFYDSFNGAERARIDSSGTFILKNDYQEQTYTANSSTAITLNIVTNGTDQVITLTGTATITMPTATAGKSFLLKLKTGAGGYTVTWSTVKWPGGTAPTLTSTASRMDIFSFFSDGTNWYGTTVGQNYTP